MANRHRAELYRKERDAGMSYRQIAEKYEVSVQRVGQACGSANPARFQYVQSDSCPYINLRSWMNDNKVSRSELLRRCGLEPCGSNMAKLREVIQGKREPRKRLIDRLIQVTGLPYEQLWKEDRECGGCSAGI